MKEAPKLDVRANGSYAWGTTITETKLGGTNAPPLSLIVHQASALRHKWVEVHRLT